MVQIIPAILATSEKQYHNDITNLERAPSLENSWIHIDFADNIFVQNKTVDPKVIKEFPTNFHKEAHLMVAHPKEWIDELVDAGFERVIFHIEVSDDIKECIESIKNRGLEVGLAINNETPIEKLTPFIDTIDIILVMTIVPGFQGQPFIPASLEKVRVCSRLRSNNNLDFKIGVDGHVNADNAKQIISSGVDFMIVGSYLLTGDIEENVENLWEVIND